MIISDIGSEKRTKEVTPSTMTNSEDVVQSGSNNSVNLSHPNEVKPKILGEPISYVGILREEGKVLRADQDQPSLSTKPHWFDEKLFRGAKLVYERHFMGVNFTHLSGLLLLVRIDSIYDTLCKTGKSDTVSKLFKRHYHTVRHVKSWYEGDIFEETSEAHRSLLIVRGMHNKVSQTLNAPNVSEEAGSRDITEHGLSDESTELIAKQAHIQGMKKGFHISQFDIMITQFAFIGLIVLKANQMGLIDDFSELDMESLLHFWRVIGFYLGSSEKMNLCSYEQKDIVKLCEAIAQVEFKESMVRNTLEGAPGIMSINIVRSLKFIPMLTVYGIMRHLYEVLDHETTEIEHRKTWFTNLSYTFIKLVMTRLLGYRPLRAFNNGLTRLSMYLVGKVEDWFAERLESQYGQELNA